MKKLIQCNLAAAIISWAALAVAPRAPAQTPPGLNLQLYAGLSITGAVGTVYSVEYVKDLAQTNSWRCLEFLQPVWVSPEIARIARNCEKHHPNSRLLKTRFREHR